MILFKGEERYVLLFYLLAVLISLYVGVWAAQSGTVVVQGGSKAETALFYFLEVLAFTGLFLLGIYLLRRYIRIIIFLLELFFLFFTSLFLFSTVINDLGALAWSLLIVYLRLLFPENLFFRNLSVSIIGGVSAGLLGYAFSVPVALLFYVLLILYDFISVFITKHMVELVKGVEDIGGEGRYVALGGGDLVLPALFSTSLIHMGAVPAVISILGSVIGVWWAFSCLRRFKRPLPALPYIGAVQITLTALSLFPSILFR